MYKISVVNNKNGRQFGAQFDNLSELELWKNSQITKNSWGLPQRMIINPEYSIDANDIISDITESDFEGNQVRKVILKPEYTYEIKEVKMTDNDADGKKLRLEVAQKQIELYKKMTEFGSFVQLYFTSLINSRPITQEQKDQIQIDASILSIKEELNFGRIGKARNMISLIVADENLYYQEDLDKVLLIMDDFLADL